MLNISVNVFYFLKNILYLNLVIIKLKYNSLIFNEILILHASYVFAGFLLHRELLDLDLGRQTPHF
jgi:hypothetical protein